MEYVLGSRIWAINKILVASIRSRVRYIDSLSFAMISEIEIMLGLEYLIGTEISIVERTFGSLRLLTF